MKFQNYCFFLLLLLCQNALLVAQTQNVTYTESLEDIVNPDRGFYTPYNAYASNFEPLVLSDLQSKRSTAFTPWQGNYTVKTSVFFRHYILDAFVNTDDLSTAFLNNLQGDFNTARAAGVRLLIRFSYTVSPDTSCGEAACPPYGDAPKSRVLSHISQLAPYLQANEDVIAAVQSGFIGVWGEQYYTDYFGDASVNASQGYLTNQNWLDRIEVLEALLEAVPTSRMVQVRYPQIKQKFLYGVEASVNSAPISIAQAHNASNIARIGFHNDCFLSGPGDVGTYSNYGSDSNPNSTDETDMLKPYLEIETQYVCMAGETCSDAFSPQNNCSGQTLSDMEAQHFSILNSDYNNNVNNDWETDGCMDEIKRRLGYRFIMKNGTYPTNATVGEEINFQIAFQNIGFAAPFNERSFQLVLQNTTSNETYLLPVSGSNTDTRFWFSGALTLDGTVSLPSNIPSGNYKMLLHLYDSSNDNAIATRPEYSIQFANTGTWETTTGYNDLNHTIFIDSEWTTDCIIVDGNASDWSSVAILSSNGTGGLQNLKVADSEGFLYVLAEGNFTTNSQVFIDTDNSATGFLGTDWAATAFDYMVENNLLYVYTGTGNNWNWEQVESVNIVKNASLLEFEVTKSAIGGNIAANVSIGVHTLTSNWQTTGIVPNNNSGAIYPLFSSGICEPTVASARLKGKTWLQGAFQSNTNSMNNVLQNNNLLPSNSPYGALPWQFDGNVNVSSFPSNVVDWLLIELLDTEYNTVEKQIAFLDTNGNWRDSIGEEGVPFFTANATNSYHIIIRHRNHVDIMSANTLVLNNTIPYDFTNPSNVLSGNLQLANLGGGKYALCAGDVDGNGLVTVADYNLYISQISLLSEYLEGDLNLDGSVTVADYNLLKENISKMGVIGVRY